MKKLIIIPTPIGNLTDVSESMRESLQAVDVVLCESISKAKKLYQCLDLPMPRLMRYWQKTEETVIKDLASLPDTVGLISDAGMPCISDPGYLLVSAWHERSWPVRVISGPSAMVNAIAGSGIAAESFQFLGFLSTKSGAREARLQDAKSSGLPVLLYESPRRVIDLCRSIEKVYGSMHLVCVMKELTKVHESYYRGPVKEVLEILEKQTVKGEFVVMVDRAVVVPNWQKDAMILKRYLSVSDAATACSEMHGYSRSKIYQFLLEK